MAIDALSNKRWIVQHAFFVARILSAVTPSDVFIFYIPADYLMIVRVGDYQITVLSPKNSTRFKMSIAAFFCLFLINYFIYLVTIQI